MHDTFTLTLSGVSSILEAHYFPAIELSPHKSYVLALVELLTFNSIPNIDIGCNTLNIEGKPPLVYPTGSYEIESIEKLAQEADPSISIKPNTVTLRSEVYCEHDIDLRPEDSIGRLLGFAPRVLRAKETHQSDFPVAILSINAIRVECNITGGAYINGDKAHTIHQFFPVDPSGYKILEVPANPIYLPINVSSIHHLQLRLVDQDGRLVNFRGETITIRIHIKSWD